MPDRKQVDFIMVRFHDIDSGTVVFAYCFPLLDCLREVGVSAEVTIPNNRMTASSYWNSVHAPHAGRLHLHSVLNSQGTVTLAGAWAAKTNDNNQWLQIELDAVMSISGTATQGRQDAAQWVTSYKIQYSSDGSSWAYYSQVGRRHYPLRVSLSSNF